MLAFSASSLRARLPFTWLVFGLVAFVMNHAAFGKDTIPPLTSAGQVIVLRHANAPGVGDPADMTLDDCTSQRNLDDRGRTQAKHLGDRLRAAGLKDLAVYTSQWCRCRDTARLLAIGEVKDLPALNSFFARPEQRTERTQALRVFLDQLPRNAAPLILVTHQVNITALTGFFPSSGEGVVLRLRENGGFERVGEIAATE
ncbi:MAG: histidine phosphatase family protein [Opitutus sp.]